MDTLLSIYPSFIIIGIFLGLAIIIFISYLLFKYLGSLPEKKIINKNITVDLPVIEMTHEEVVKAVRKFSEMLPKGVYRTILVEDDHSIDFKQLAHILGGIPSQTYYMSKETYDIYTESEKDIPPVIDKVQKAVDLYVKEQKQYPMLSYDKFQRVNYYQLIQGRYLDKQPEIDLYITEYDGLISHVKPKKNRASD